jgi:hypothetical protein
MPNELILDGGCLCGVVRYRATAVPTKSSYCHCRMCQRSAGAPVMAWVGVPASTFVYVAGAPEFTSPRQRRSASSAPLAARNSSFESTAMSTLTSPRHRSTIRRTYRHSTTSGV